MKLSKKLFLLTFLFLLLGLFSILTQNKELALSDKQNKFSFKYPSEWSVEKKSPELYVLRPKKSEYHAKIDIETNTKNPYFGYPNSSFDSVNSIEVSNHKGVQYKSVGYGDYGIYSFFNLNNEGFSIHYLADLAWVQKNPSRAKLLEDDYQKMVESIKFN